MPVSAPADPYAAPQVTAVRDDSPQIATAQYAPQPDDTPWVASPFTASSPANPYDTTPYGAALPGATPYATAGLPPYGPGPGFAPQHTNGLAIASLVTSLAAVLLPITGAVGLVLGIVALRAIQRDGTQGRGLAIAGIAVGAVFTVMAVLSIIFMIAMFAGFAGFTSALTGQGIPG